MCIRWRDDYVVDGFRSDGNFLHWHSEALFVLMSNQEEGGGGGCARSYLWNNCFESVPL